MADGADILQAALSELWDPAAWATLSIEPTCPVADSQLLAHIRANSVRELPHLRGLQYHELVAVWVGGGPSAKDSLEEIRARASDPRVRIFCSNYTHDWLIDHGIVPSAVLLIDPQPGELLPCLTRPAPGVKWFVASSCEPAVFDALAGQVVVVVHLAQGIDGEAEAMALGRRKVVPVCGGSTAALRAMWLFNILGFRTADYYGVDSSYPDRESYFAYDGARDRYAARGSEEYLVGEYLVRLPDDDRLFWTDPGLAMQAKQFIHFRRLMAPLLTITVHGNGLLPHLCRRLPVDWQGGAAPVMLRPHDGAPTEPFELTLRLSAQLGERESAVGLVAQALREHAAWLDDERAQGRNPAAIGESVHGGERVRLVWNLTA